MRICFAPLFCDCLINTARNMADDEDFHRTLRDLVVRGDDAGISLAAQEWERTGDLVPRRIMAVAQALHACGDSRAALQWYERIGPSDRPYEFAQAQIARLSMASGDFGRVIRLTGAFEDDRIPLGLAFARAKSLLALEQTSDARAYVDRIEGARGAPANLLEVGADAAAASGDWSGALDYIERAIAKADEPRLRLRRGIALFHLGRDKACAQALTSVAREPDCAVRALAHLVRLHQRSGEPGGVIESCEGLLERDPANEFGYESIIRQYLEINDQGKANYWFQKAQKILPNRFTDDVFVFMKHERYGRYTLALRPFNSGERDESLPESFRERIAATYYLTGRYGMASRLMRSMKDPEAAALLRGKIRLASEPLGKLDGLPDSDEAKVVAALHRYLAGDFGACIELLQNTFFAGLKKLSVDNFKDLARAGRILPNTLFSRARPLEDGSAPLPIIQQLWVGSKLSYIEQLSMRSFIACGHKLHLYSYDSDLTVPPGVELKDARQVLPESDVFAHSARAGRSRGSLAGFADLFRWKLLHDKGGAWADSDLVCLRPLRVSRLVATELSRTAGVVTPAITNCFFSADPGEPEFLNAFERARRADHADLLWGEIGTHAMAEMVAGQGWGDRLADPSDFCPIPSFRMIDAMDGHLDVEEIVRSTGCRAVHLYNEVLRVAGVDKSGEFPRRSIVSFLETHVANLEADACFAKP